MQHDFNECFLNKAFGEESFPFLYNNIGTISLNACFDETTFTDHTTVQVVYTNTWYEVVSSGLKTIFQGFICAHQEVLLLGCQEKKKCERIFRNCNAERCPKPYRENRQDDVFFFQGFKFCMHLC